MRYVVRPNEADSEADPGGFDAGRDRQRPRTGFHCWPTGRMVAYLLLQDSWLDGA